MATKTRTRRPAPTIITADGRDTITCNCGESYCGITFTAPTGHVAAKTQKDLTVMVHNYANMGNHSMLRPAMEAKGFRWEK